MISPDPTPSPSPQAMAVFSAPKMPAAPQERTRVFGLDALRAAAILAVVLAHGFAVLYAHVPHLGLLGHGGFYGVELFFVLSGFLIGNILIKSGPALGHGSNLAVFYTRRWFRTLPLFWLFVAVNVGLEFYLRDRRLPLSEIASHGFFLRTVVESRTTFFPESWSLAIEEWFYLLFPAVLWLGLRLSKRQRFDHVFLGAVAAFYLLSTFARVAFPHHPATAWHTWPRMIVVFRFDALMIGVAAAWIATRFPAPWVRAARPSAMLGAVLLVAAYASLWSIHQGHFVASPDSSFARTFRFNLVSLGFALLLPAASTWNLATDNIPSAATRKIALWSYGMYLAHLPVFQLTQHHFFKAWPTSASHAAALFALQIGLTFLISAFLFRAFETPCTRLREKVAPRVARWFGAA